MRCKFYVILKFTAFVCIVTACLYNVLSWKQSIKYQDSTKKMLNPKAHEFSFKPVEKKQFADHKNDIIKIEILSSRDLVKLRVNKRTVFQTEPTVHRGIHIFVLNQNSGDIMGQELFDTFSEGQSEDLLSFCDMISDSNRLLVFAVQDEASFHLSADARKKIQSLGSKRIFDLNWRCMWAFVTTKSGRAYSEQFQRNVNVSDWADPVVMKVSVPVADLPALNHCNWPDTVANKKRKDFCASFDGYGKLCDCKEKNVMEFSTHNFEPNFVRDIPVVIIASNRPHYLYRMLRKLMSAVGANPDVMTIFIDGHFEETKAVAELFGVHAVLNRPVGTKNARISQHYLRSLSATFEAYPSAEFAIILEEDLDVAPDFYKYFSSTLRLFEDSSIYCVSAWNDHGYQHSSQDPTLLYRIEGMPGLGWMLKRSLFLEELKPNWPPPQKQWDWDMWMRLSEVRKGRECIIPDVSRTFHFGTSGVNMNSYFFQMYFSRRKINEDADVTIKDVDSLSKDNYENHIHQLVRKSRALDVKVSPCDQSMFSNEPLNASYVVYFHMKNHKDIKQFVELCKCLNIWDLDPRCLHKSMFRTFVNGRHVIFVGYPLSPYSIYKPSSIKPINLLNESSHDTEL